MKKHYHVDSGFSTIALVIAIGAAIILGVGAYLFMRSAPSTPASSTQGGKQTSMAQSANEELTGRELSTTIPDLVSRGQSLECDWKMPIEGENPFNTGKLWTNGNKGRSSVTADISGIAMESNALYQSDTVYTWTKVGGQTIGMKFTPSKLQEMNSQMTAQERQQAEQIRQSMLFNCKSWTPDETKFVLPQDVEFKEYNG